MIVIDKRTERTIKFENVKCGEMFYDSENEIFCLRIQECWDNDEDLVNAVDIVDGQLMSYMPENDVVSVKGRVEINE